MLFELDKVCFTYADGSQALHDISAEISHRGRYAILGANGSGKSTLLRILNGLDEPQSGTLSFDERHLTAKRLSQPDFHFEFRTRVGFVFQDADAQLFNPTVWEEVAFGPRQLGLSETDVSRRVLDTLSFLGIEHLAHRAPFRLSGGEKRKVAIASVLSMNPEVILFDEPVAGLDPRMQSWLVRTLNDLQRAGKTTIVSTHNLQILPLIAGKALILNEEHGLHGIYDVQDVLRDEQLLSDVNLIWRDNDVKLAV
jgi:cobalt/nickel transport system ATP-binding protein